MKSFLKPTRFCRKSIPKSHNKIESRSTMMSLTSALTVAILVVMATVMVTTTVVREMLSGLGRGCEWFVRLGESILVFA